MSLARWKMVALLTAAQAIAYFHRSLVTLFAEPIRVEFGISDTLIGILIGAAFSVSYVVAALPLGHAADRGDRFHLLSLYVGVWSLLTSLAAMASNFAVLLMLRMGSASAMAGLTPAAGSLLATRYDREALARPMGIYASGIHLGVGLSMLGGSGLAVFLDPFAPVAIGPFAPLSGWKVIFLVSGLPGLVLAAILASCSENRVAVGPADERMPVRPVLRFLTTRPLRFTQVLAGLSLLVFVASAIGAWLPSLFLRNHGWQIEDIGLWYGLVVIVSGLAGTIGSGYLVELARRLPRIAEPQMLILLIAATLSAPAAIALPLASSPELALALLFIRSVLGGIIIALGYTTLLGLAPESQRARLTAIAGIAFNLIGGALAPLTVALTTDFLFADPQALPRSLSLICGTASIAALFILAPGSRRILRAA